MNPIAILVRRCLAWWFRVRGLSTMAEIDGAAFDRILAALEADRWKVTARYGGIDAGIDYDCIRLRRDGIRLKCEWDRWDGWSIQGPTAVVSDMAERFNLSATSRWRWAGWDADAAS